MRHVRPRRHPRHDHSEPPAEPHQPAWLRVKRRGAGLLRLARRVERRPILF